ncbi:MAG TPA: sugar ABC transporter permease [Clostridia bacterium]
MKQALQKTFNGIISKIKLSFYNLSVKIHNKKPKFLKKRKGSVNGRNAKFFYAAVLFFPLLQFLIFYVFVNINSILLSLQRYDMTTGKFVFMGLGNFKAFLHDLFNDSIIIKATYNSITLYLVGLLIGLPLNIIFSYFLYKQIPLNGFFRVVLFLPQIISSMVISLMFKFFVERGLPSILEIIGITNAHNLITRADTAFKTIIFYCIWSGFGTQIIIYSSAMSRVPQSLIEAGKLDGLTAFKEFWHIILPLIFPTITTFLVVGVAGLFTAQAGLYDFFGPQAPYHTYTYGYFLFVKVIGEANIVNYPYASAAGIIFTMIAAPLTLLAKYLLEKFGPTVEY